MIFFEDYSSDFVSFADEPTPYKCAPTLNDVINNLEITAEKMFEWFSFNSFKANASKCHLFLSPYELVPVETVPSLKAVIVRNC